MFDRVPDTPMNHAPASVCSNNSAGKHLLKINNKSNFEKNFPIAFIINFGINSSCHGCDTIILNLITIEMSNNLCVKNLFSKT